MNWFEAATPLLPDIIRNNADHRGALPAVICGQRILNWRDFERELNRVANAMSDLGLEPGDRVAMLMNNSVDMLTVMLGVISGGFVAVPLNVSVSDDGICRQINDSGASAVVASSGHDERIDGMRDNLPPSIGDRYLAIPTHRDGWTNLRERCAAASDRASVVKIDPQQPCNVIYSSGTTGLPKGIVHSHACRMAWAYDMSIALRYHSDARTLISLGLYSNITWVTMLATVLAGGTLVLLPAFDATSCLRLVEEQRISHAGLVPVQFQRMLADPAFAEFDLSSVQALMCCGSPLRPELKQQIIARIPGDFIELYGLTEGLVTIQSPADAARNPTSVGRPCPGQMLRILDAEDRPARNGVAGEIVGYGRLLMSGYLNRDTANAESTWTDESGRRWLRTGDIGRLDDDGNLYLVDRKKDMIISGGQNIYPADIEAVVAQHPDVVDVAVIGVSSQQWGESPFAVVTGSGIDTQELLHWVNERVGKQQRLAALAVVDELPRNPNGKVLKHELRKRFRSTLANGSTA